MTQLAQIIREGNPAAWRPVAARAAWAAVEATDLAADFIGTVAARLRDGEEADETHVLVVEALADELAGLALDHPDDDVAARRASAAAAVVAAAQPHPGRAALDATRHAVIAVGAGARGLEEELRGLVEGFGAASALPEVTAAHAYAAARAFALAHGATLPEEPDGAVAWGRAVEQTREG